MVHIELRQDRERGCGWRKGGGIYLIAGGVSALCGLLPIPLDKCPTCSYGIKPTRGWTWIEVLALTQGNKCKADPAHCIACPLHEAAIFNRKQGLLWIGGSFYARPNDWTEEAIQQGVSRRISSVPKDFQLGETWVFVAHREAWRKDCPDCFHAPETPSDSRSFHGETIILDGAPACKTCKNEGSVPQAAIFHAFKPTAIEYVVKGDESEDELAAIAKRGITLVRVERIDQNGNVIESEPNQRIDLGNTGVLQFVDVEDVTEVEPA